MTQEYDDVYLNNGTQSEPINNSTNALHITEEQANQQESVMVPEKEQDMYKQTDFTCSLDSTEESILPWSTYSSSDSVQSTSLESDMEFEEEQNSSSMSSRSYSDDIRLLLNGDSSQESIDEDYEATFPLAKLSSRIFLDEYGRSNRFVGAYSGLRYVFGGIPSTATIDHHITDEDEVEVVMMCSDEYCDQVKSYSQLTKDIDYTIKNDEVCEDESNPEESRNDELNLEQETSRDEETKRTSRSQRFRQRIERFRNSIVNAFNRINCFRNQEST